MFRLHVSSAQLVAVLKATTVNNCRQRPLTAFRCTVLYFSFFFQRWRERVSLHSLLSLHLEYILCRWLFALLFKIWKLLIAFEREMFHEKYIKKSRSKIMESLRYRRDVVSANFCFLEKYLLIWRSCLFENECAL